MAGPTFAADAIDSCQRDRQLGEIGSVLWAEDIQKQGRSHLNLMIQIHDRESGVYMEPDGAHGRFRRRRSIGDIVGE